jgi:hypothetical protein
VTSFCETLVIPENLAHRTPAAPETAIARAKMI